MSHTGIQMDDCRSNKSSHVWSLYLPFLSLSSLWSYPMSKTNLEIKWTLDKACQDFLHVYKWACVCVCVQNITLNIFFTNGQLFYWQTNTTLKLKYFNNILESIKITNITKSPFEKALPVLITVKRHYFAFCCKHLSTTLQTHTREYRHVESVLYEQYVPWSFVYPFS